MTHTHFFKRSKAICRALGLGLLTLCVSASLLSCTSESEELKATLIGPADVVSGGAQIFTSTIDTQLTTSCGTASAASTDTSDTSGTSGTTSSPSSSPDSSSTVTKYTINAYIQFMLGETLLIKFTYDEDQESFRMVPSSSTAQTCPTTDFISCNGTDGVNPTCETTDNISCGGANSFIYTSKLPLVTFQASSGTIDWNNGFTVNSSGSGVEFMDLEFDMVSATGAIFSGTVRCVSQQ